MPLPKGMGGGGLKSTLECRQLLELQFFEQVVYIGRDVHAADEYNGDSGEEGCAHKGLEKYGP